MSNQQDPNVYSLMCRCPLEDAARLRLKAKERGLPMSAYVAKLIQGDIKQVSLSGSDREWIEERLDANMLKRAKADKKTASGYYRVKKSKKRKKAANRIVKRRTSNTD